MTKNAPNAAFTMPVSEWARSLYACYAGGVYVRDEDAWLPREAVKVSERIYEYIERIEFPRYSSNRETTLERHIAKLRKFGAKAPEGAKVVIKFGIESGYEAGDETAYYEVGYWRDPTNEEKAERHETNRKIAERDKRLAEAAAAKERAEFERLKAKFASDSDGSGEAVET